MMRFVAGVACVRPLSLSRKKKPTVLPPTVNRRTRTPGNMSYAYMYKCI